MPSKAVWEEISRVEQHRGVAEVGEYAGNGRKCAKLHVYDCALMGALVCA